MSTIPYRNLFAGGAGIFGAIGDGFQPGNSLEVSGNGSAVRIEVSNVDAVPLHVERARAGTNLWSPLDQESTEEGVFEAIWAIGFLYRIRQMSASPNGVIVFVVNNTQLQINNGSVGGFVPQENSPATLAQLQLLTEEIETIKSQQPQIPDAISSFIENLNGAIT